MRVLFLASFLRITPTTHATNMKLLASLLVLLASTVQGQGPEYSEYGDYQDYQEYGDEYGQQDSLYADYAQRQQVKAAGGGG